MEQTSCTLLKSASWLLAIALVSAGLLGLLISLLALLTVNGVELATSGSVFLASAVLTGSGSISLAVLNARD